MKTITLEGVEYELVPVYEKVDTTKFVEFAEGIGSYVSGYEEVFLYYGLKPTEVTNQSLS